MLSNLKLPPLHSNNCHIIKAKKESKIIRPKLHVANISESVCALYILAMPFFMLKLSLFWCNVLVNMAIVKNEILLGTVNTLLIKLFIYM